MTRVTDAPFDAKWWTCGSGLVELLISKADAAKGSHQGKCDDDIQSLRHSPYIQAQLSVLDVNAVKSTLREYGAWDAIDLLDHDANLSRLLWIACGDIQDERT